MNKEKIELNKSQKKIQETFSELFKLSFLTDRKKILFLIHV